MVWLFANDSSASGIASNRWFSFSATNLASSQTYLESAVVQCEVGGVNYIKNLYGQKLFCKPYDFEGNAQNQKSEIPGRCILDESIFESYYRQRGDVPLDKIFALYQSSKVENSKMNEEVKCNGKTNAPIQSSIEPSRNLIAYGIDLIQQQQQKQQHGDATMSGSLSEADAALMEFLQYYAKVPEWVNPEQIVRGQQVLTTYMAAIGATLYYRSLVPGFSIPKIAMVLLSTGYLAPPASRRQVQNRLLDTGAFIAAISALRVAPANDPTATPSDTTASNTAVPVPLLEPYSEIWQTVLQVRVLHAKVRHALMQRKNARQWNTAQYGIPINQEDLAATLLAFSYNALLGIEFILGCPLSSRDQLDYLHFWRYIGWLLGVETIHDRAYLASIDDNRRHVKLPPLDPCGPGWLDDHPNPLEHSYSMFASILLHLSKPDSTSVTVAHHLLQLGGANQKENTPKNNNPKNNTMWYYFRSYQCRRYVGHELANALLLPVHPNWYRRWELHTYSTLYLLFLRLYTWMSVPRSPFQSIIFRWHQKHLTQFFNSWKSKFTKSSTSPSQATDMSSDDSRSEETNNLLGDEVSSCPFAMVAPPQY